MNDETLRMAEVWRTRGDDVALATVVRTRRSAPRPLGSKFAISRRGEIAGSVSGGCVESAVVEEAQSVLAGGQPKLLYYGIADDLAWDVGLACGGEIWVWVERYAGWPVPAERSARVTAIEGDAVGRHVIVTEEGVASGDLDGATLDEAVTAGREAIAGERNATVPAAQGLLFAEALVPPPRLVAVGAVDTAEALCAMARRLGWRTVVIDPRASFATADRLPSADRVVVRWPEQGYDDVDLRPEDAVVVLTHDPKLDDPAIRGALRRGAGYIGALGSRRTQSTRRERLIAAGADPDDLDRVAGPVGLDIGANTPEETALSILAEIVAHRSGRGGGRLKGSSGRIHVGDESVESSLREASC